MQEIMSTALKINEVRPVMRQTEKFSMMKSAQSDAKRSIYFLRVQCSKNQLWTKDGKLFKQNNRCRKCLRNHHTDHCEKPDGTTCNKCTRRHHRSLHNERMPPDVNTSQLNPEAVPYSSATHESSNNNVQGVRNAPGICPVQKLMVKDKDGNFVEVLAMLDSGSNTSFISKDVAKKLGISGPKTHLTMNLAGGLKKSEESELVNITVAPISEESIQKSMQVYALNKPCGPAKTVSRKTVNSYQHLEAISNKLHLSGGTIDLLIGTDFADAFVDIHVISGGPGEPIAKRNCFGWFVMGQIDDRESQPSTINSVDVGTVSALEDMTKLHAQDMLGVKPTELCTSRDDELEEKKFIKMIADSTQIIDGRDQERTPWTDDGPPKESNSDVALQRMLSSEKTFKRKRKNCFEDVQVEIPKLFILILILLTLAGLYSTCKEALEFAEITDSKTVFWMDSQTVLTWIKTPPKRFKPFVSARVAEIQETLDTQAFLKYNRSDANPADTLTRGAPPEEIKTWMEGPPFLLRPEEEWPKFEENSKKADEESFKEMKSNKEKSTNCKEPTPCTVSSEESTNFRQPTDNPILQHLMKTYSTFAKARKTLAYVLRFINNTRKKENDTSPILPEELKQTELQMFKWCQETIKIDTVDQKLMSKPDEQGLLRAYGRLESIRSLPNEIRNPIISPNGHQLLKTSP
ncbi:hypothetical protein ACROYT_G033111 [Oculina patagonica]